MTREALLAEIMKLPLAERLELMDQVWDSTEPSVEDLPVPDWHKEILDARLRELPRSPTLSWDEAKARLGLPPRSTRLT